MSEDNDDSIMTRENVSNGYWNSYLAKHALVPDKPTPKVARGPSPLGDLLKRVELIEKDYGNETYINLSDIIFKPSKPWNFSTKIIDTFTQNPAPTGTKGLIRLLPGDESCGGIDIRIELGDRAVDLSVGDNGKIIYTYSTKRDGVWISTHETESESRKDIDSALNYIGQKLKNQEF